MFVDFFSDMKKSVLHVEKKIHEKCCEKMYFETYKKGETVLVQSKNYHSNIFLS